MITRVRAWRKPEHEELLDTPVLTPRQEQNLQEFELQHEVKLHERLHGKDLDGIAKSYRSYMLAQADEHRAWLIDRIKGVEQLQSVFGEIVAPGSFDAVAPGAPYLRRAHQFRITNRGESVLSEVVSLSCLPEEEWDCKGADCDSYLFELSGGLEGELGPGETQDLEDLEIVQGAEYSETDDLMAQYQEWRCWTQSATIDGDYRTCCFSDRPEQAIAGLREQIESTKEMSDRIRSQSTFEEFFAEWLASQEEPAGVPGV